MDENGQGPKRPIEEPESLSQLGDCLRASFPAGNHDTLGDDSMRSLLHLSRETKTSSMRIRLASS